MEPKFYPEFEPVRDKIAMISQPMNGRTDEEILKERKEAMDYLIAEGYSVINTFFNDMPSDEELRKDYDVKQFPVFYLAMSIGSMAECDAVYFVKGWDQARGCKIEHEIALQYGLLVIEGK